MVTVYILGGIAVFGILVLIVVAIIQSVRDKKIFRLMQAKGTVLTLSKENYEKRQAIMNQLTLPVRVYLNGPDQTTLMPRWSVTLQHFIMLADGGLLFDVWVAPSIRSGSRASSKLYVVEFKDGAITHFVSGKEYLKNGGTFDGLSNATFKTDNPARSS
jgi:hypothetical protein